MVTGSGTTRTLSPVTVSGNGIITVSIRSVYKVETGTKNIYLLPDTPTSVTTAVSASTVTLSWDPVYLSTGYRVYRNTTASGAYAPIGTTSSASYTDIRLSLSTTRFYRVTAFNSAGESVVAAQVSVTTLGTYTGQAIAASSDTIVLEWSQDAARDKEISQRIANTEFDALGYFIGGGPSYSYSYVIYRDEIFVTEIEIPTRLSLTPVPPFFTLVQDSSLADHFYVDAGLEPNTNYNYRVAINLQFNFGNLVLFSEDTDNIMIDSATTLSDAQR